MSKKRNQKSGSKSRHPRKAPAIRREKSHFGGSRLYRQARELADELLAALTNKDAPFSDHIRAIGGDERVVVRTSAECDELIGRANDRAEACAARLDPYLVVTGLVEAITRFYYPGNHESEERAPWLGIAMKRCLAHVWRNVHARRGTSKAIREVIDAVGAAGLAQTLYEVRNVFVIADGTIEIGPDGAQCEDGEFADAAAMLAETFRDRGRVFRTAKRVADALHGRIADLLPGLARALHGENPSQVEELAGTIFAEIPAGEPPAFWAGLLGRVAFMIGCVKERAAVTEDPAGIAVLGRGVVVARAGGQATPEVAQKSVEAMFWQSDWYAMQAIERYQYLLVDRPALRIRVDEELFVSSGAAVVDSITWFVESSLTDYRQGGGVLLSNATRQRMITKPFEDEIVNFMRGWGFVAGGVSEDGIWSTQNGNVNLAEAGGPPTGEIDCLAVDEKGRTLVLEAKVLSFPYTMSGLTNVIAKLGPQDSDCFRAKLRAKIAWATAIGDTISPTFDGALGLIVLDRVLPVTQTEDGIVVCELSRLGDALTHLNERVH